MIVIGAGIVGLAVARELLSRQPDRQILVLEKEPTIASHQTGHNSGVIHSGIYYQPGSLKALTCREGNRLLHEFADHHHLQRERCGKLIVAAHSRELAALEKIYEQGKANKIPGLRMVSYQELNEREPHLRGRAALSLPEVALIDFREVSEALKKEIQTSGGTLHLHRKVNGVRSFKGEVVVETDRETFSGSYLINCGGLYSDKIARLAGCEVPVRILPFRGEYFRLIPEKAKKIKRLIYPVPDPRLPFLGVHLTPTLRGEVLAGPNAVLALAREGYSWKSVNLEEVGDYLSYPGFWRMAARYWRTGFFEMARSLLKPFYAASVRNFLPCLKSSDLLPAQSGVRAQAVNAKGDLIHDFLYLQQPRAIHILNAPSPAATASLAIAKQIVTLVLKEESLQSTC